jgi:hypothetical protein
VRITSCQGRKRSHLRLQFLTPPTPALLPNSDVKPFPEQSGEAANPEEEEFVRKYLRLANIALSTPVKAKHRKVA